jgi:uncharacterized membrane protein YbhN (UPF0104 family)
VNSRRWIRWLRLLPPALLVVVIWREKPWTVPLSAGAPWAVIGSIVLNLFVFLPLKAARWRVALIDPPPYRSVLAALLEGLLAGNAIGLGSADVVRAARLRASGGQFAADYGCTWAERGAEALAMATLVFSAALLTGLGTVAVALSGLAMAGYVAVLAAGRRLVPRLGGWPRVQRALSAGLRASTPRRVAAMAALSLLGWASEIVMLVLFQYAFHIEPDFRTALLTLVGINAAIAVPIVPGNFGPLEAGATAAMVLCGVPREVAVLYAVTYHLTHAIPVAIVATAVFAYRSRRYRTTPALTPAGQ